MAITGRQTPDPNRTRTLIAFTVIGVGIVGIVVISWVAMATTDNKDETARLVFASVLPLIGTWVGAVLAFYFSRDNLQAASETTLRAVREAGGLTAETLVKDAMTRVDQIQPKIVVADDAEAQQVKLKELYDAMQTAKRGRIPILTDKQVALYVVHEPDIDKYAQAKGTSASTLTPADTLAQLLADPATVSAVSNFVTVPATATLGDARSALGKAMDAKDVFVTDTGQKSGVVLGWLTNSDLARTT